MKEDSKSLKDIETSELLIALNNTLKDETPVVKSLILLILKSRLLSKDDKTTLDELENEIKLKYPHYFI